jgi:hypothetical protein
MERWAGRLKSPFNLASQTIKSWFSKNSDRQEKTEGGLRQESQANAGEWSASLQGDLEKITSAAPPGYPNRFVEDRAALSPSAEKPRLVKEGSQYSVGGLWNPLKPRPQLYKQSAEATNDSGQAPTLPLLPFQSPPIQSPPAINIQQGTKSVSELLNETIKEVYQASGEQLAKPPIQPSSPNQALSRGLTVRQSNDFTRAKISEILNHAEKHIAKLVRAGNENELLQFSETLKNEIAGGGEYCLNISHMTAQRQQARNDGVEFIGKKLASALGPEEKQKLAQAAEPIAQKFIQGVKDGSKLAPIQARQAVSQLYDGLLKKRSQDRSSSSTISR